MPLTRRFPVYVVLPRLSLMMLCTSLITIMLTLVLPLFSTGGGKSASAHTISQQLSPFNTARPSINYDRAALAFYYPWYNSSDWCSCHMSDLPTIKYTSSDDATIDRQLKWAASAGLTGFISSWWGPGDNTDQNFAKLLDHSAQLEQNSGYYFGSTIYFESDAPRLQGKGAIIDGLRYVISHYSNSHYFQRWHGKPILFFWKPVGNGRTLSMWADIRRQVDPNNRFLWDAEGIDMSLLDVFDGIHLFSAGYWGLLNGNMLAVDKQFRDAVAAYNAAHHTHKSFAAGVMPGYDDTRIPGRTGTFKVPRHNGDTYRTSWSAAIQRSPDLITITSFNEWFEGSMIEPSVTYNTQYLDITKHYTKQWHG